MLQMAHNINTHTPFLPMAYDTSVLQASTVTAQRLHQEEGHSRREGLVSSLAEEGVVKEESVPKLVTRFSKRTRLCIQKRQAHFEVNSFGS